MTAYFSCKDQDITLLLLPEISFQNLILNSKTIILMKKLLFFCFLVIAPSLFAEKIYLMDLYTLIPVEDEEVDWQIGNRRICANAIAGNRCRQLCFAFNCE